MPLYDRTLHVLLIYLTCLIIFGIASTLFILPDETSQTAAVGLFVVARTLFRLR